MFYTFHCGKVRAVEMNGSEDCHDAHVLRVCVCKHLTAVYLTKKSNQDVLVSLFQAIQSGHMTTLDYDPLS